MATWRQAVFGPVKDENFAIDTHCCDDVWVLRLISSFVDFAGMINLLHYGHLNGWRVARRRVAVATNLSSFIIIVPLIRCNVLRKLDICDLEVIRCII